VTLRARAGVAAALAVVALAAVPSAARVAPAAAAAPAPSTVEADPAVALTPPMGWNSWSSLACSVTERDIRAAADAMVASGMRAAGYRYVNVDDCWYAPARDAAGRLRADPVRFPSGIAALAAYVHRRGLRFGIYASAGVVTCAQGTGKVPGQTGSKGHEATDAATFAAWGVDLVKFDWCGIGTLDAQVESFTAMGAALRATGRPIVYSINPHSGLPPTGRSHDWSGLANMVRTTRDVFPQWHNAIAGVVPEEFTPSTGISDAFTANTEVAARNRPGHWNDLDMLVVGVQLGDFTLSQLTRVPPRLKAELTALEVSPRPDEQRTQFALWALSASPLIAGNDITTMSAATRAILTNPDLIAVDQDRLGIQGRPVRDGGANGVQVWVKPLADGSMAVGLLNRSTAAATITTTAEEIGMATASRAGEEYTVRDLWTHRSSRSAGTLSATVPAHGTAVLRVFPAGR
jgi:alpha-galactosidase